MARRPSHGPRSDHRRPARLSTVAQAEGILAGYTSTVAQISGDDRLTPEAKAVDLAKAHTKAQTDLSGVRATVEQQEAETVERLASSVFGNPASTGADVIAARDADDRAARYHSRGGATRAEPDRGERR